MTDLRTRSGAPFAQPAMLASGYGALMAAVVAAGFFTMALPQRLLMGLIFGVMLAFVLYSKLQHDGPQAPRDLRRASTGTLAVVFLSVTLLLSVWS